MKNGDHGVALENMDKKLFNVTIYLVVTSKHQTSRTDVAYKSVMSPYSKQPFSHLITLINHLANQS